MDGWGLSRFWTVILSNTVDFETLKGEVPKSATDGNGESGVKFERQEGREAPKGKATSSRGVGMDLDADIRLPYHQMRISLGGLLMPAEAPTGGYVGAP